MTQVRKSPKQWKSEAETIRKEIWGGLLPWQIIQKEKITPEQYEQYVNIISRQAGKRFQKLDVNHLALESELYLERLTSIAVSCSLLRAKACVNDSENEIDIEPDYMRLEAEIWKLIMEHKQEMFKTAEVIRQVLAIKKQQATEGKDIPITKDNSHMGVS